MRNIPAKLVPICAFLCSVFGSQLFGQGTAFTYQGRLNDSGAPFTGSAEFQATLWGVPDGGSTLASNSPMAVIVGVTNGVFVLPLNFGANFPGAERWLQLEVRTAIGPFTTLTPRQQLTPTPYAITASNLTGNLPAGQLSGAIGSGSLSGTYSNAMVLNNPANSFSGNGAGVTNVNAATLGGLSSSNFWKLGGNAGANPTNGNFLGTTDNQPLDMRVNGVRALRLELTANGAPNVIGGSPRNFVAAGIYGATIVGGGSTNFGSIQTNSVLGSFGSVLGGRGNTAGGFASVAMGQNTSATGDYSMAMGYNTTAISNNTTAMGINTTARGDGSTAMGYDTDARGVYSTAMGFMTEASGHGSTAMGGSSTASGLYSTAMGRDTLASEDYSTAMGSQTTASSFASTAMGYFTRASGLYSVSMGYSTTASGSYSFAAGYQARASHRGSFVWADSTDAYFTSTTNDQFLIRASGGVGINLTAPAVPLHVGGGSDVSLADGGYIMAGSVGGLNVTFDNNEIMARNDGAAAPLTLNNDGGEVRTGAGLGVGRALSANDLEVNGTASKSTAGDWLANSDARIKQSIETVTGAIDTLNKVRLVSFRYTDDYRAQHKGIEDRRYLNVVAQEFRDVFPEHVKSSGEKLPDGSDILQVDIHPLTIYSAAAVQELNSKLKSQTREMTDGMKKVQAKLSEKEAEIAELKQRIEALEKAIRGRAITSR